MSDERPPLTLTVPSELRMLPVARAFVEAVCHLGRLEPNVVHAVVLACGEAFTNVVRHAHRDRPDADLQVECRLLPEGLEVCVHDQGDPFDLSAVPHLDPKELRVGGRGVFLMRALMDELASAPRAGGGNTLRMVKHIRRTPVRDCG